MTQPTTITLEGWTGPWPDDDKDANFKAEIAAYAHLDPLSTIGNLSNSIDVPVGSIVHYILCRWASEGSSGGLVPVKPLSDSIKAATPREEDGDDGGEGGEEAPERRMVGACAGADSRVAVPLDVNREPVL